MTTTEKIKVRACQIINNNHPEWGTFGVVEKKESYFEINGKSGSRILFFDEANEFWSVA